MTMQAWREESRRDKLTRAQIDLDRDAARAQLRIAEGRAAAQDRRDDQAARAAARQQARKARAARRAGLARWVRGHVIGLLFVPVIAVPGALAWTAMAAFGAQVYGPAGVVLPAFSEGAMWAFAAAVTITRRTPGKPVWHLRAGTWVFAAAGAAMNFAHGLTTTTGLHGPAVGAVMAVVSVAGVTAHQLVTAGPRRTRAERGQARIARAAARREVAARRAAVRHSVARLDESGHARLVYAPGLAALARRRGRTRLLTPAPPGPAPAGLAALTLAGPASPWPRPSLAPPSPNPAPTPAPVRTRTPSAARTPARTHTRSAPRTRTPAGAPGTRPGAVTDESAEVHFAADLARGEVPSARRVKAELHVGQDRAAQIHTHLTAVAAAPRQPARRIA